MKLLLLLLSFLLVSRNASAVCNGDRDVEVCLGANSPSNLADADDYEVVVGGGSNTAKGPASVIVGGGPNFAGGYYAVVVGGQSNVVSFGSFNAFIGGGASNAITSNHAVVSGGQGNGATADFAVVGGGASNSVLADAGTISGGELNTLDAKYGTIGGGQENTVAGSGIFSVIGGGYANQAVGRQSTIGGGRSNAATSAGAAVAGGRENSAKAKYSFIGGGWNNAAQGYGVSVVGGESNSANGTYAVVGGGNLNKVEGGQECVISGGLSNSIATTDYAFIGGGASNSIASPAGMIGGGTANAVSGSSGAIAGGDSNIVHGDFGFVGGGEANTAKTKLSAVVGGGGNVARGYMAAVVGGSSNAASGYQAFVGGGALNTAGSDIGTNGQFTTVSGGYRNTASLQYATIGGGGFSTASAFAAAVGGGLKNTASGFLAAVMGGWKNVARGDHSSILGGAEQAASGEFSSIGGGSDNTANATGALVAGGRFNAALGDYAIAGGAFSIARGAFCAALAGNHSFCSGPFGVVAGGSVNSVTGFGGVVGGGVSNTALAQFATIGGGTSNVASGLAATIGGGVAGAAVDEYATVSGGQQNVASGRHSTVAGGYLNTASARWASVGGGWNNGATSRFATCAGGVHSVASGYAAVVVGGESNTASSEHAFVGGGRASSANAKYSSIVGGAFNGISSVAEYGSILGGKSNTVELPFGIAGGVLCTASGYAATVSGGDSNQAAEKHSCVAGGASNSAGGQSSFVGGGEFNSVDGMASLVVGGLDNQVDGYTSAVLGGRLNVVSGNYASLNGGYLNSITASYASIGGGEFNKVTGTDAAVMGGGHNHALGRRSSIAGGWYSTASGYTAMVAGGNNNLALGDSSFAAGRSASAKHHYSAVLSFAGNEPDGAAVPCNSVGNGTVNVCVADGFFVNGMQLTSELLSFNVSEISALNERVTAIEASNRSSSASTSTRGDAANNSATGTLSVVIGGFWNTASGQASTVGGAHNTATGAFSASIGGHQNTANGESSSITGGTQNTANGKFSAVVSGVSNRAVGDSAAVFGGQQNYAASFAATVAGGESNSAFGESSLVGAGANNSALGKGSTVVGGLSNQAIGVNSFVGTGSENVASGDASSVASGANNHAIGFAAAVVAGQNNSAFGELSIAGGGRSNNASGFMAVVGGGRSNVASGSGAGVLAGYHNEASGTATVAAGARNIASGHVSVVAGGMNGLALGGYAAVGGGFHNTAASYGAVVSGGVRNVAARPAASVGGGQWNEASAAGATVAGGENNSAFGVLCVVAGGVECTASGYASAVGGGYQNIVSTSGAYAAVGGGYLNTADAPMSSIGGGRELLAAGYAGVVAGGSSNSVTSIAAFSCIVGGEANTANEEHVFIGGGSNNAALGSYSTIGGGKSIVAQGAYSSVAGGTANYAIGMGSVVGGGQANRALGDHSVIGGGHGCAASGPWSVAGGGYAAMAGGNLSTISGGAGNTALGYASTIGGGGDFDMKGNAAFGDWSTVGGGFSNTAAGKAAAVGGGWNCSSSGDSSTVVGGGSNTASAAGAFVGGGLRNIATGRLAAVMGGSDNSAQGNHSAAMGSSATATHAFSAVWGFSAHRARDGARCQSMGEGTVHVCTDSGFFVDGHIINISDVASRLAETEMRLNLSGSLFLAQDTDLQRLNASIDQIFNSVVTLQSGFEEQGDTVDSIAKTLEAQASTISSQNSSFNSALAGIAQSVASVIDIDDAQNHTLAAHESLILEQAATIKDLSVALDTLNATLFALIQSSSFAATTVNVVDDSTIGIGETTVDSTTNCGDTLCRSTSASIEMTTDNVSPSMQNTNAQTSTWDASFNATVNVFATEHTLGQESTLAPRTETVNTAAHVTFAESGASSVAVVKTATTRVQPIASGQTTLLSNRKTSDQVNTTEEGTLPTIDASGTTVTTALPNSSIETSPNTKASRPPTHSQTVVLSTTVKDADSVTSKRISDLTFTPEPISSDVPVLHVSSMFSDVALTTAVSLDVDNHTTSNFPGVVSAVTAAPFDTSANASRATTASGFEASTFASGGTSSVLVTTGPGEATAFVHVTHLPSATFVGTTSPPPTSGNRGFTRTSTAASFNATELSSSSAAYATTVAGFESTKASDGVQTSSVLVTTGSGEATTFMNATNLPSVTSARTTFLTSTDEDGDFTQASTAASFKATELSTGSVADATTAAGAGTSTLSPSASSEVYTSSVWTTTDSSQSPTHFGFTRATTAANFNATELITRSVSSEFTITGADTSTLSPISSSQVHSSSVLATTDSGQSRTRYESTRATTPANVNATELITRSVSSEFSTAGADTSTLSPISSSKVHSSSVLATTDSGQSRTQYESTQASTAANVNATELNPNGVSNASTSAGADTTLSPISSSKVHSSSVLVTTDSGQSHTTDLDTNSNAATVEGADTSTVSPSLASTSLASAETQRVTVFDNVGTTHNFVASTATLDVGTSASSPTATDRGTTISNRSFADLSTAASPSPLPHISTDLSTAQFETVRFAYTSSIAGNSSTIASATASSGDNGHSSMVDSTLLTGQHTSTVVTVDSFSLSETLPSSSTTQSLSSMVGVLSSTSISATVRPNSSTRAPLSHGQSSSSPFTVSTSASPGVASTVPARPADNVEAVIHVCQKYPCDLISNVTSVVLSSSANFVLQFQLLQQRTPLLSVRQVSTAVYLLDSSAPKRSKVWHASSTSLYVAVNPRDFSSVGALARQEYGIEVTILFQDGTAATDSLEGVFFAEAPQLYSIALQAASSSSTLLRRYTVAVNATSYGRLFFAYSLIDPLRPSWEFDLLANGASPTIVVPANLESTVRVKVVVSNEYLSTTQCSSDGSSFLQCPLIPQPVGAGTELSSEQAAEEVVALTANPTANVSVATLGALFLTGLSAIGDALNATKSSNATASVSVLAQNLYNNFFEFSSSVASAGNASTSLVEQQATLLAGFVDTFIGMATLPANSSHQLANGVGLIGSAINGAMGSGRGISDSTIDSFLGVVDAVAGTIGASDGGYEELDSAVGAACGARMAGSLPGDAFETNGDHSSISCISSESDGTVVVDSGNGNGVSVSGASDDGSAFVVAVALWNDSVDEGDGLVSPPQSVSVVSRAADGSPSPAPTFAGTVSDGGYELTISTASSSANAPTNATLPALRKTVQCTYWDGERWSDRGMLILGFDVFAAGDASSGADVAGITVSVICLSSHLSLFAVADNSIFLTTLDEKLSLLSSRVAFLDTVDLADNEVTISWPILLFFCLTTGVFLTVIVVTKACARKTAATEARKIFQSFGVLERPQVIGSQELDAIVRGHSAPRETTVLVLLDIVTVNPFLSLFFEWSHEAIVYNRSDKSFILYSQIMVSCIVMALFLDFGDGPLLDDVDDATVQRNVTVNGTAAYGNSSVETSETNEGSNELANTLAEVFIQAIIAQILLFPVKYLLPYMISNVNSISSAAGDATKSVVAHIQNMMSRPHASRATSKNDHATGEANLTASGASPSSPMRRGFRSMDELREVTEEKQRDIIDYWQNIVKEGAYMRASSEYGPDGTSNAKLHVTTERSSTECMAAAISADEARAVSKTLRLAGCLIDVPKPSLTPRALEEAALLGISADQNLRSRAGTKKVLPIHPAGSTGRGPNADGTTSLVRTKSLAHLKFGRKAMQAVRKFQARVKTWHMLRTAGRRYEFDAWHVECKAQRNVLKSINITFLAVVASFTFTLCLLLAASYTAAESQIWVIGVLESLAMQVFVADVLIGLGFVTAKLFFAWALLQCRRPAVQRKKEARKEIARTRTKRKLEQKQEAKRVKAALRMAMAIQQKLQQQASQVRDNEDFKTQLLVADQSPAESTKAVRKSEHDALKHEHALTTNGVEQPSSEQKTPHQPAPSTPARPRRANRKRAARRTRSHRSRKIVGNVLSTIEESPGVEDVVTAEVGRVTDSANSTVVPQKVIEVVDAALAPEHRSRESGNDLPLSPRFSETAEKRSIIPSSKLDALKQHWQAKGQNFPGSSVANSPTNGATAEQDACGKRSPSGRGVIRPDDDWIDPHEKGRILALSSPSAARSPRQKMRARSIQHRTAEAESALNAATATLSKVGTVASAESVADLKQAIGQMDRALEAAAAVAAHAPGSAGSGALPKSAEVVNVRKAKAQERKKRKKSLKKRSKHRKQKDERRKSRSRRRGSSSGGGPSGQPPVLSL